MTFSIRLKGNLEARLERLATLTERPKAFYVNASLLHGLSIDVMEAKYLPPNLREGMQAENRGNELGKGLTLGTNQMSLV
jgi:predicted DNA-binding protein